MRGPPGAILAGSAPSTWSGPTRKSKPSPSAVWAKSRMGLGPVPISVTGMFTPSCIFISSYLLQELCPAVELRQDHVRFRRVQTHDHAHDARVAVGLQHVLVFLGAPDRHRHLAVGLGRELVEVAE